MALSAAKFRSLADKIVAIAGDVRKSVTYVQVSPGDYDTETGETDDAAPVEKTFLVFATGLDETEMSWFQAPEKVMKLIIPYGTWAAAGITVKRNDYVIMDGLHWEIKRVKQPPAEAFTKLFVESP